MKFSDGRKAKIVKPQLQSKRVKGASQLPLNQRNVMVPVMESRGKGKKKYPVLSSRYRDFLRSTTTTRRNGGETVITGGKRAKGRTR